MPGGRSQGCSSGNRRGFQGVEYACDVVLYSEFESQAAVVRSAIPNTCGSGTN